MTEHVTIAARFNGPPGIANGGYVCGLLAKRLDGAGSSIRLRRPTPLEKRLEIRRVNSAAVELLDRGELLVRADAVSVDIALPSAIPTVEQARGAAVAPEEARMTHPVPGCFGCGPDRSSAEAVRLLPGPVAGDAAGLFATSWIPPVGLADEDLLVPSEIVWSALDRPSSFVAVPGGARLHVLAQLDGKVLRSVKAGVEHVVIAWPGDIDGRRRIGDAASVNSQGELCGISRGTWIELRT